MENRKPQIGDILTETEIEILDQNDEDCYIISTGTAKYCNGGHTATGDTTPWNRDGYSAPTGRYIIYDIIEHSSKEFWGNFSDMDDVEEYTLTLYVIKPEEEEE